MQPFFIVNPELSLADIHDALIEKFTLVQMMHSMLLFNCFDGQKLKVSEEFVCDGLWIMADLLKQLELLHNDLSKKP